jgi:5-(carboxyamino)imidazole ribonucleotide synthase
MKTLGIAGGGQLGRMLTKAAHSLGHRVVILDGILGNSAAQIADVQIVKDYRNSDAIRALAEQCDVLTYEVEKVNVEALIELSNRGFPVHPKPQVLLAIKDKLRQKSFLQQNGIAVSAFRGIESPKDVIVVAKEWGYPIVLKTRFDGFDGRGNALILDESGIDIAFKKLGNNRLYAEKFVHFKKELAVVGVRDIYESIALFPVVETLHVDHICHLVRAPAGVSEVIKQKVLAVARRVMDAFASTGALGIEMFLVGDTVIVNEVAPRVHNSGHFSIDACNVSQFDQHVRAVCGMPLESITMSCDAAVMVNILGDREGDIQLSGVNWAQSIPRVNVHIYGKLKTRLALKMGHITATGGLISEVEENALEARRRISI